MLGAMNRTETPPLDDDVLHRLWDYTDLFRPDFRFRRQAAWAAVYVRALLQDGERKSVEPLALRVPLPPDLCVRDPVQAMQNFVNRAHGMSKKSGDVIDHICQRRFRHLTRSSSSTTRHSPRTGSIRSESSGNTAGHWARRTIAKAPYRYIMSAYVDNSP